MPDTTACSPQPFEYAISQTAIDNLKQKLLLAQFPDELEDSDWDYGSPLADIKRLVTCWQEWDFQRVGKKLNELPSYTVDVPVDGFGELNVCFVHQRSEVEGAIPLLFVHGWPGSILEVSKILPLLSDAQRGIQAPAFHVVAPSLPNFGSSQGVSKRGFGIAQYAETCHNLMSILGYKEYVTQGGDWGYAITRAIGALWPDSCKASHYNIMLARPPKGWDGSMEAFSEREKAGLQKTQKFVQEGSGYNMVQSTRPQTLSYALQDSPVALLSWIYEKLVIWTDSYPWTDDEILVWISVYAFSRPGPGASTRIYYENMHAAHDPKGPGNWEGKRVQTREDSMDYLKGVKLGMTWNPQELVDQPRSWCRSLGEVVFEAENDHGGLVSYAYPKCTSQSILEHEYLGTEADDSRHFYAYEHPEWLARDLHAMFGRDGGAYGIVQGKVGYDK